MPIIPDTQESEIKRIVVKAHYSKNLARLQTTTKKPQAS
jgi:hypothetical protein